MKNWQSLDQYSITSLVFKTAFDRNDDKWDDIKEKRRNAGKNHTGNQYTRQKEMEQMEQVFQNGTNGTVSVSVSDSVSVSGSVSVNNIVTPNTHTQIFDYCSLVFPSCVSDDLEKSCQKMFRHYETKKWENVFNWKSKAEEWVQDDIDSGKIKTIDTSRRLD